MTAVGDRLRVRPGEAGPVDGTGIEGRTTFERWPVAVAGDRGGGDGAVIGQYGAVIGQCCRQRAEIAGGAGPIVVGIVGRLYTWRKGEAKPGFAVGGNAPNFRGPKERHGFCIVGAAFPSVEMGGDAGARLASGTSALDRFGLAGATSRLSLPEAGASPPVGGPAANV